MTTFVLLPFFCAARDRLQSLQAHAASMAGMFFLFGALAYVAMPTSAFAADSPLKLDYGYALKFSSSADPRERLGLTQTVALTLAQEAPTGKTNKSLSKPVLMRAEWRLRHNPAVAVPVLYQPTLVSGRVDVAAQAAQVRTSQRKETQDNQTAMALGIVAAWRNMLSTHAVAQAEALNMTRLQSIIDMMQRRAAQLGSVSIEKEFMTARIMQARVNQAAAQAELTQAIEKLAQTTGGPLPPSVVESMLALDQQRNAAVVAFPQGALADLRKRLKNQEGRSVQVPTGDFEAAGYFKQAGWRPNGSNASGRAPALKNAAFISLKYQPEGKPVLVPVAAARPPQTALPAAAPSNRPANAPVSEATMDAALNTAMGLAMDEQAFQDAIGREALLVPAIQKARTLFDTTARLYLAGQRNWLDLLGAARQLTEHDKALAPVRAQLIVSSYLVKLKLGQLNHAEEID